MELVDTPFVSIPGFGFDSIDCVSSGDVEGVALRPAEAKIGSSFGKQYASEQFSSGTKHLGAIAGAGPQVSFHIAPHAVWPALVEGGEYVSTAECPIGMDIEHANVFGRTGIGYVELGFVRRKAQAVGLNKIIDHHRNVRGKWIVAENVILFQFPRPIAESVIGIGEPNGSVAFDDDIIRRVEFLSMVIVQQCNDQTVPLLQGYLTAPVFGGYDSALQVQIVSVRLLAWDAEN